MPAADEGILSGGPLSENYQILQLHFHWGKTNDKGSEHTYDGSAFPLEMHIVHVKSSLKDDLDTALKTIDGLAVTGFQFQIVTVTSDEHINITVIAEPITNCFAFKPWF